MTEPKPMYAVLDTDRRLGPYLATLNCRSCHSILASVTEFGGRTAVILRTNEGHPVLAFRARFRCECGEERLFSSVPMSAVRLGIVEDG